MCSNALPISSNANTLSIGNCSLRDSTAGQISLQTSSKISRISSIERVRKVTPIWLIRRADLKKPLADVGRPPVSSSLGSKSARRAWVKVRRYAMAKNTVCLWYYGDAEAAARFYAETFPDSAVGAVHRAPGDYPSGKAGDVLTVEFTVA